MKAIAVTCPHCGGRLQVAEARDTITCEYCGTSSRIQRRTRMLERIIPPPPPPPGRPPMPLATQRRSAAPVVIGLLAPMIMVGGIVGGVYYASSRIATRLDSVRQAADAPTWQGTESVLVTDINGDGLYDFVGRSRRLGGLDEIRIVALDGKSGATLWETDKLGNYNDTYTGSLTLSGDLVLFTTTRAELRAYSVKDGKQRWTTKLPERVKQYCATPAEGGDPNTIIVLGSDDVFRYVNRASGASIEVPAVPVVPEIKPDKKKKPAGLRERERKQAIRLACAAMPTDQRVDAVRPDYELGRKNGINPESLTVGPGGRVMGGTREKGTRVAMFVALDAANATRWKIEVPQDPLGSVERAPQHVVVGPSEVCGAYSVESAAKGPHIACFALADGKRIWDSAIGTSTLSALVLAGRTLVVSTWGTLESRDAATGALRWRYGK